MAALLLLKTIPITLRHRLIHRVSPVRFSSTALSSLFNPTPPQGNATTTTTNGGDRAENTGGIKFIKWEDSPEYRQWKDREAEILQDIEPIVLKTKEILHSKRYADGECLSVEDEKAVVERLLAYHPHCEDKIGAGLDSIMVDRHPQFRRSRCLFVIRTDGAWIDFSYQKCLRSYIRDKYPCHAERFIREHFKRGSGSTG
ncbi:hypothetical protein ACHQM5_025156 [Ranunculus cassubicifolius]